MLFKILVKNLVQEISHSMFKFRKGDEFESHKWIGYVFNIVTIIAVIAMMY